MPCDALSTYVGGGSGGLERTPSVHLLSLRVEGLFQYVSYNDSELLLQCEKNFRSVFKVHIRATHLLAV